LFCPWSKFAKATAEGDFSPRHKLDHAELTELFGWSETEWLEKTAGSPIRRIGYERWLRNLAVALGNAPGKPEIIAALKSRSGDESPMVREHVDWALAQHACE
jgi:epoxyqueuosine reductase